MATVVDGTRLSAIIAPAFYPVHWDIADGLNTYYDLFGGRGSTKSSFISVEIVLGIMEDPAANAVVFRKVGNTIGTSVYEQILWSINALGVEDQWKTCTSPYRLTYKPTGQVIIFRGSQVRKKSEAYSSPFSEVVRNSWYLKVSTRLSVNPTGRISTL